VFFRTSYDSMAKVVSAVVCAIVVVVTMATGSWIVAGLGVAVVGLSFTYAPRGYTIAGQSILVHRPIGNLRIPLAGVQEARAGTSEDLAGCIRLFGSGGLFGYYGLFQTSKLGRSTWYVTDRDKAIVVITAAKTAVFSPDDGDGFLAAIRACAPVPLSSAGAMQTYRRGSPAGVLIGGGVGVAVLAVMGFAMLYSPGPPSYTLTP